MNEDKSARYHRLQRRASVLSFAVSAAVPALLLASGASVSMRDLASTLAGVAPAAVVVVYVLLFVAVQECVSLPLVFYRSFVLERRYGLSRETPATWVRDHLKAVVLGTAIAAAGTSVVYASLRWSPPWWWIVSAAAFVAGIILLTKAAPVLLMPLFYTFVPLDRESLRERLFALTRRTGVPVLGAFVWKLGDRTRRANAALVGTGATRRILLSDTLLSDYSEDEIEVILAHELAHHVRGDIRKGLLVEAGLVFASFAAAAMALRLGGSAAGLSSPADVAGLPLLLLAGGSVMAAATPAVHAYSRRNERAADDYALRLTGRADAFVSAMRRLAAQNLADERPSRLALLLFHSHPPISERLERARAFAPAAVIEAASLPADPAPVAVPESIAR